MFPNGWGRSLWMPLLGAAVLVALAAGSTQLQAADEHAASDAKHAKAGGHEGGGHGEHGGHFGAADHGPALEDPTEVRSDLALFTAVVFLLMLGVLGKFAWGPICAGLSQREHSIADHIASAHRAMRRLRSYWPNTSESWPAPRRKFAR